MANPRILHITPHLGGGVGQVLLHYLANTGDSIATLDYANEKALASGLPIFSEMYNRGTELLALIEAADITVIHFWNHPLLWEWIANTSLPPCRMVFWAHVLGHEPPQVISAKILEYPDFFAFTSPVSLEYGEVRDVRDRQRLRAILSTAGIDHIAGIEPQPHSDFTVGYIGTVDFSKMHPCFVDVHKKIENARFLIVGGDKEKEISRQADERFVFTGKVADIRPYLAQMDVFGYLLHERHYGTAELVLQEAMAAGVVPVVLDNPAERSLVTHGKTGLVAKNLDEYIDCIHLLRRDENERQRLSGNAKAHALSAFSLATLQKRWEDVYSEVLRLPKRARRYTHAGRLSPYEVFLESLGKHSHLFLDENDIRDVFRLSHWHSETKGTPKQYLHFFGDDDNLKRLCGYYG